MGIVVGLWAVAIGVFDAATARIPNWMVLLGLAAAVLTLAVQGYGILGASPLSCGLGFVVGGLLPLAGYAAGMLGAGDVKFAAALGALLGLPGVLWALLASALVLGVSSLSYLLRIRLGRQALRRRIPAGPALAIGALFVLFDGPAIVFA